MNATRIRFARLRRRVGVAAAALLVVAGVVRAAPPASAPLSLDDVAALRDGRTSTPDVVREFRSRGRAFDLDAAARERLEGLGFNPRQIDAIAKTRKPGAGDSVSGKAAAGKKAAAEAALKLSPEDVAKLERLDKTVKRTVELCNGGVTVVETGHARLLLGSGVPPGLDADLGKLEAAIAARFPGPLADGVDKRGVNIAVFVAESEHAVWIAALEKALAENGYRLAGPDGLAAWASRSPAISLEGITTVRATGTPEETRRTVAHAFGFHALDQLTRGRCGDGLQSGFANIAETTLFGTPGTTVRGGYADRQIGAATAGWLQTVQQRFASGTASKADQALGYTFDMMEFPHYAECWSLATMLCMKPEMFTRLVMDLREGGQPLWPTVTKVYGGDAAALTQGWKALVLSAR